ncbi:MAG: L-seryl-tRNA(Sec) selenium transferase [Capsulimonadales bacterium]|nr:L-seryl-tRNA(Sec) selenium transferase [Capsulimonadales bacterium]
MTGEKTVMAALRGLPSVEKLAASDALKSFPHATAVRAARQVISDARRAVRQHGTGTPRTEIDFETLVRQAREVAAADTRPAIRPAINATGVLLHTNLGRATLAPAAAAAVETVAGGHASLEVDEETGARGSRQAGIARLLCELTGAEDAYVVNNNAAATFLAVAGVAGGREVVLSRGQMVEIGGQFRLPEVIESAGARLVEVGTTNRTRIGDYERAMTDRTAMLLRVHPSNYRIVGFTEEASLEELIALGRARGVTVGDDIGSGALIDLSPFGLRDEPLIRDSVAAGADLIWFSGDKLLGGPQAGILIGTTSVLAPLKRHPLARALRPDKLTLAGLEATLRIYRSGDPWQEIPVLRRIARSPEEILAACGRVARALREALPGFRIDLSATLSEVGGGSLPGASLPSWAVAIEGEGSDDLARRLRRADRPVYGRMEKGRYLLDLRAVDEFEEAALIETFRSIADG